jgi:phosphoenolpyruvate carboxykinase (ATP)
MITDHAWQSLFVKTMFIEPTSEELEYHEPKFTVFNINDFEARPELDGTRTSTFILLNFTKKLAIIGGTRYGGENKKTIFGVLNFILPGKDIMPMHCSANLGLNGDTALFFGLSGTGKTTLSADPKRMLIGDDEHGWSDDGIFNFEGGCYAKTINLSKKAEPQIWNAIRDGAVLENVVLNPKTMNPDYDDDSLTENTRVVYPLDYIPGAVIPSVAGHPKSIIFLTADAFGVLPPISKLTTDGAMYHFMSGYTSKLAGTERGIIEPQPTFSHCFGSVFMPRPAEVYAKMLGERIVKHNTNVYLVNTGWSGGPYGVGKRFKIEYTRKMITAVLNQSLEKVNYERNKVFNLDVPKTCPGVPSKVLDPKKTWKNKKAYDKAAKSLAKMFVDNFKKFKKVSPNIKKAGPKG